MEDKIIEECGIIVSSVLDFNESYFIEVISQSKYLTLMRDKSLYHLRIENNLDPSILLKEKELANYLILKFPFKFDERLSTRRSGDINRFIVAKGTLVNKFYG